TAALLSSVAKEKLPGAWTSAVRLTAPCASSLLRVARRRSGGPVIVQAMPRIRVVRLASKAQSLAVQAIPRRSRRLLAPQPATPVREGCSLLPPHSGGLAVEKFDQSPNARREIVGHNAFGHAHPGGDFATGKPVNTGQNDGLPASRRQTVQRRLQMA